MANSKQIVYLSQSQYAELIANGSITVDGVTVTYDENDIYVTPQAEPVTDVQIAGTSITNNGVANVPLASISDNGVVKIHPGGGLAIGASAKTLYIDKAVDSQIKAGTNVFKPIVCDTQHMATFYGLAKAAGDITQSQSSNAVGTYTPEAQAAIQNMLGISQTGLSVVNGQLCITYEEVSA